METSDAGFFVGKIAWVEEGCGEIKMKDRKGGLMWEEILWI